MKKQIPSIIAASILATLIVPFLLQPSLAADVATKPNVLFILADDASRHIGEAYGCRWVKTPNIDRLAKEGLVFESAYTPTPKCSSSRAAIFTGRNPWQLEDAANHWPTFPSKFMVFPEALTKAGVFCGGSGKFWGPGATKLADGKPRYFGFTGKGDRSKGPGGGFAGFLKGRPKGQPFFYWYGSLNPHRSYKTDAGLAKGKKPSDIDRVPAYWPDDEIVRRDMLDYAAEMEDYDAEVGELLAALDASGEAANTLVIVTSDNGMPFPRVKGNIYDDAVRMPFIARWPAGIVKPGRRVAEPISFVDLAPTFFEIFGVDGIAAGMSPMTGQSLGGLFRNDPKDRRSFAIVGRERDNVNARAGSPSGLGYPVRAIREGQWFFVINYETDRWPCGDPLKGMADTDGSPTKLVIAKLGKADPFWQHAFGKRPAELLFDVVADPDCVKNLASDPAHAETVKALREKLTAELTAQQDPRVLGKGDVFDQYISPR